MPGAKEILWCSMLNRLSCSLARQFPPHHSRTIFDRSRATRRMLSILSVHSTFPATLLRFQYRDNSGLFDFNRSCSEDCDLADAVTVSKNGLVYPKVSKDYPFSNGATFLPNTFMMQEIIRRHYDQYLEELESDGTTRSPLVLSIPKGVPVPTTLVLFREHTSQFSLQPSHGMSLTELNSVLDDFYSNHADKHNLEQWLEHNDFQDAVADDAEAQWLVK